MTLNSPIKPTWCPSCLNFQVLAAVKNVVQREINTGKKEEDFAIVAGIGCHAKIFDYINLNGINTLHGRVLPTCLGMKLGNPNLNVIGFSGDGDAYAEGMEHLIHAARYNADFKYFVHNNQVFALTVGQPTPTTEIGFKDKTNPLGVKTSPINPIALMLASGCGFVARVYADMKQIEHVFEEAMKYKGFAFIEILEPCIIFHNVNYKDKIYSLENENHDKTNLEQAMKKAQEFDYSTPTQETRIPMGIFYQKEKPMIEDMYPQLKILKEYKIGWKDIKR
ncbi:MAG: thiamine pyrophosphate-dependent enzyme [Nanoarchaeota archaeon]|nr:thiamine pyrophosphate-dependent enzyme [Nanoarchaeota archaeon]